MMASINLVNCIAHSTAHRRNDDGLISGWQNTLWDIFAATGRRNDITRRRGLLSACVAPRVCRRLEVIDVTVKHRPRQICTHEQLTD